MWSGFPINKHTLDKLIFVNLEVMVTSYEFLDKTSRALDKSILACRVFNALAFLYDG